MPLLLGVGFPGGSVVKHLPANAGDAGDAGLISGSGRSPGEGNGTPLQYSCLGNPMDRGAWQYTVHGIGLTQLSDQTTTKYYYCINVTEKHFQTCKNSGNGLTMSLFYRKKNSRISFRRHK